MTEKKNCRDWANLRPLGRTVWNGGALAVFWTGSGIELLTDSTELWLEMNADFDQYDPWISVEVDGAWLIRTPVQKGESRICLFRGLKTRVPRHVRILKEVQPMPDDGAHLLMFTALEAEGDFLPLPQPAYRLEFVGDSITSGEGAMGAGSETDWCCPVFSAVQNYARMTADALGAEYRIVSQSGWGVICGWDNHPLHTLPSIYPYICGPAKGANSVALGSQKPYDFDGWRADAVIINLGTNDDGAFNMPEWVGPNRERFKLRLLLDGSYAPEDAARLRKAAGLFLRDVRRVNPAAKLVWAYGMLGHRLAPELERALAEYREESGDDVTFCLLPDTRPGDFGSRSHPGRASHRASARVLTDLLKKLLA